MNLKYGNLTIREATRYDAGYLHKNWNKSGWHINLSEVRSMLAQGLKSGTLQHIIELNGMAIGDVHYGDVDGSGAEIGIYIRDESAKNKGCGTLALTMMIDNLFHSEYNKIVFNTGINNGCMRHIAEKKFGLKPIIHENVFQEQSEIYETYVEYVLDKKNWQNEVDYEVVN